MLNNTIDNWRPNEILDATNDTVLTACYRAESAVECCYNT